MSSFTVSFRNEKAIDLIEKGINGIKKVLSEEQFAEFLEFPICWEFNGSTWYQQHKYYDVTPKIAASLTVFQDAQNVEVCVKGVPPLKIRRLNKTSIFNVYVDLEALFAIWTSKGCPNVLDFTE